MSLLPRFLQRHAADCECDCARNGYRRGWHRGYEKGRAVALKEESYRDFLLLKGMSQSEAERLIRLRAR